ncbi:hypothetical protein LN994_003991 [Salmonella enterica]|nr:hypothetical protein [Salmonella enterica]ECY4645546.1 hypothetical protein [Salmonella enterica subsp. enterica serovar Eastbourne]EDU9493694.1 hypothetical protein [Salmonella enterica subsp. enterica]EDV0774420.1 hypothetical protein [Salmonella enterica subsp. enterica]EIN0011230.1 hypothetical protein [Salmonella enterica]
MAEKEIAVHQIFLVSPCHYLLAGLEAVMKTVPVKVMPVSRPEEIQSAPGSHRKTRLVLVSVPVREPKTAARASLFLWRLMCLQAAGYLVDLPVLLLSDMPGGSYPQLSERTPPERLRHTLTEAVTRPGNLPGMNRSRHCELSALQQKILMASLAGLSVEEMALALNISRRGVFTGRTALMNKLGLRNRLGLMSLVAADFI